MFDYEFITIFVMLLIKFIYNLVSPDKVPALKRGFFVHKNEINDVFFFKIPLIDYIS